jgi:hypothetical protein
MATKILFFIVERFTGFILFVLMLALTLYFMRGGKISYIRRVPALDAIEEGIGRSAEMGRPVIASPGAAPNGVNYWTIAALSILTYVAEQCAKHDLKLFVPLGGSEQSYTLVEIARDIVESQYTLAGRREMYKVDDLPFLSGRQFAWASAYCGMMMREKPALNVMVGEQWATAIYISEVSHETGTFTLSASTYLSNVACLAVSSDYIMIGEEMVAAGAYLSKEPVQLASIVTQDLIKGLAVAFIIIGVILQSMGSNLINQILST